MGGWWEKSKTDFSSESVDPPTQVQAYLHFAIPEGCMPDE